MRTRDRAWLPVALVLAAAMAAAAAAAWPAAAQVPSSETPSSDQAEQQQRLVDRATLAAQDLLDGRSNGDQAQRFLSRARGVLICPNIFRMSFLIGGSGGGCVLLARDGAGSWSDPAFYSMGSGSVGFQAGVQNAELMMFIMTRRGLTAIMDSQFKIGADASITLATLGTGLEGATSAAFNADLVVLQKSSGLFAGISLQGSMLSFDSAGNRAYYGQPVGVQDITVTMRVNSRGADPLRAALMRFGGGQAGSGPPSPYPAPYQPHAVYDNSATADTARDGAAPSDTEAGNGPIQLEPSGPVQSQSLPPPR